MVLLRQDAIKMNQLETDCVSYLVKLRTKFIFFLHYSPFISILFNYDNLNFSTTVLDDSDMLAYLIIFAFLQFLSEYYCSVILLSAAKSNRV